MKLRVYNRLVSIEAGGTGAGLKCGDRKDGEAGHGDFWVSGFRIGAKKSLYRRCTVHVQRKRQSNPADGLAMT